MSNDLIKYNGYQFNEYSEMSVSATMQDDDSGRTTLYHRYKIRVETTIYAGDEDNEGEAGLHFRRIRDRLTKKGQALIIYHKGFDAGLFEVNTTLTGQRDLTFGPHPRVVTWDPIGHENAVHVVWECELCISACNRWDGIMSINYSIGSRIDKAGYTTRTISGYLEIAMTRVNVRRIPDSADAYRDFIVVGRLPNFEREHHWNLSSDKRRAEFTITDTQIRSPNEFPVGVISIRANHNVGWSRRQAAILPQTITASIELAQGVARSRAWAIFKAIVDSRLKFIGNGTVFLESVYANEEIFGNSFNFNLSYRLFMEPDESILSALPGMFTSTGLGSALNLNTWQDWSRSVEGLQSHRGQANLSHDPSKDQLIDMCSNSFLLESQADTDRVPYTPGPNNGQRLVNSKPSARKSYLKYESYLGVDENVPSTTQVPIGQDDSQRVPFAPGEQTASLGGTKSGLNVSRFVESQSGMIEASYMGYAERVGYPIPRPDKLTINGVDLVRKGEGKFLQKFQGNVLGQPVYAASWNMRYVVDSRPGVLDKLNDWENV